MTRNRGFTLIELAIVLVIVTILIGGLAVPLTAQIQARRIAETKRTLEEAREAIVGYAMTHTTDTCTCTYTSGGGPDAATSTCSPLSLCPVSLEQISTTDTATFTVKPRHYLPCPDLAKDDPEPNRDNDGDGSLNDLNNGREDRYLEGAKKGECSSATPGNLPWVTLGAGTQDAWGNRLRYAVTSEFANKTTGFSSTDPGKLQVCSASGCATVDVADDVPAVVISHGPNGWGARNINGNTLSAPTGADELENTNGNASFVSRTPSPADHASGEFDDLVVWLSDGLIRGRVCPSGGCP